MERHSKIKMWAHAFLQRLKLGFRSIGQTDEALKKKRFAVLHNKPQVRIVLSRDSVCAGDDVYDHTKIILQPSYTEPQPFIYALSASYLPSLNGDRHTWDCFLNGVLVGAVLTTGVIAVASRIEYSESNEVYFKYNSRG